MAGSKNAMDQLKQFWASRNGRQKAFLLGGAAATALLLGFIEKVEGRLASTAGTCAVMGTASTMASIAEAIGIVFK